MNAERWARVRDLFTAALDEPPGARRSAFLDRACGGDRELRAEAEAMLAADARSGSVLEATPGGLAAAVLLDPGEVPRARRIGPYRVLRELGRGGMGTVYLAEREDVAKRVALKIVRGGLADPVSLSRFLRERRVLARLAHPNIASLVDAGVADDGTPWFAMEYVDGETLLEHADRHRLAVSDRLALFLEVCAAVSYAHRNLVVHRDVKPSNILVSSDGEPKLVDFGIVKLLTSAADEGSEVLTVTGARLMTPDYAAPEQLRGDPVTTATDVYALGLVLYELLTGHRALRPRAPSLREMERVVLQVEPVRPSSAVARSDSREAAALARARGTDPAHLRRRLRGDLDAIVLKALRKDPSERYASVDALAEDLERHLARRPVTARRGSRSYRARRFVERNRTAFAAALLVVTAAAAVGVRERILRARAERMREAARIEAAKAERVTGFLVSLFDAADPFSVGAPGSDTLRLRDYLVLRGQQVLAMRGDPEVKLQVLNAVGRMYTGRALDDRARPVLDSALALALRLHPEGSAEVVRALHNLADYHRYRGDHAASERAYRTAIDVAARRLGPYDEEVAAALNGLGDLLREAGKYAAADSTLRRALAMEAAIHGRRSREVAHVLNNLGLLLWERGDFDGAEPMLREALSTMRATLPPDHPELTAAENNLGLLLSNTGRSAEAEPLLRDALARKRRALGPTHPRVAKALANLATILGRLGRLAEAESSARAAVSIAERAYGRRNASVATYQRGLALTLLARGKLAEAEAQARAALATEQALLPPTHIEIAGSLVALGRILLARGEAAAALPLLQRGTAMLRARFGNEHRWIASSLGALGECLVRLGRREEGEAVLRESVAAFQRNSSLGDPEGQEALAALVRLYDSTGRAGEAARYRALVHDRPR